MVVTLRLWFRTIESNDHSERILSTLTLDLFEYGTVLFNMWRNAVQDPVRRMGGLGA
jgi:hypothetical protein